MSRREATQVVNGGGAGGSLSTLSNCTPYKTVTGFKAVFLDNKTGRTYARDGERWKFYCNIGIRLCLISNTKSTQKFQSGLFPRQMHFDASKNKVFCQINKACLRHQLFQGISEAEFEVTLNDRWVIMQQHQSPRPDMRFKVLAQNHSNPLVIECTNVCGLRFSVHPSFSQTTKILQNWIDNKIKDTFEKGHIDKRFHADRRVYTSPNLSRHRSQSAGRTREPLRTETKNADWQQLEIQARNKLRPQSACDARPSRSTPTSSKTVKYRKTTKPQVPTASSPPKGTKTSTTKHRSRKTVRTPPHRRVSAESHRSQFSGHSSTRTIVIRSAKVGKR